MEGWKDGFLILFSTGSGCFFYSIHAIITGGGSILNKEDEGMDGRTM